MGARHDSSRYKARAITEHAEARPFSLATGNSLRSAATGPSCRHVQTVAKVSRLLPPDAFERRCNDQSGRQSIQRLCVRLLPRQAEAHLSNRAVIHLGSSSGAANRTFLSALDTGDRHPQIAAMTLTTKGHHQEEPRIEAATPVETM